MFQGEPTEVQTAVMAEDAGDVMWTNPLSSPIAVLQASLWFLKTARLFPTSGPLHMLSSPPETLPHNPVLPCQAYTQRVTGTVLGVGRARC